MPKRILLLVYIFVTVISTDLSAQIIPPDTGESEAPDIRIGSKYSLLPIAGYTSDWGFFGGLFFQRINYGTNIRPFLSNTRADLTFSTKGNIISEVNYEHTRTFGSSVRSLIEFTGQRFYQDHYFGIGNQTVFSNDLFEDEYFFYENREFSIYYQARKAIFEFGEYGQVDLTGSLDFSYLNGISRGENTRYSEDSPFGFGKSWSNKAGIGFIADNRENEFAPTRGFRYKVTYQLSSQIVGSEYTYSQISLDMRHYLKLHRSIVLAQKLNIESIQGRAPFWDLSIIGGEDGLRGYHLDRFRGDQSVFNLLELRTWLFSVWNDEIRVGSQVFWDTGRVFSAYDSDKVFDNWKHSYGGGVIFSAFSPDLLFRMDIGLSDETYRIHFGAGYVF